MTSLLGTKAAPEDQYFASFYFIAGGSLTSGSTWGLNQISLRKILTYSVQVREWRYLEVEARSSLVLSSWV